MLRFLARPVAKLKYRWRQEAEAATNELQAKLAESLADERTALVAQLTKEADDMDARIKEVEEMENKGYWLCENGHENADVYRMPREGVSDVACIECKAPVKFIKRDQMTGQEKYESDKERGEAQDIVKQKRQQAAAEKENVENSKNTAKYFRSLAVHNRGVADKLRKL